MTAYLNLSDLERHELENLLLQVHGAYIRTLKVVRENTSAEWKVRRETEKIADELAHGPVFRRAFARLGDRRDFVRECARNDRFWDSLTSPASPK